MTTAWAGLDVEEPSDPDHALLDELLEKDRGAASPVPTPEPRYLCYEKGGSKKSDIPASSNPASEPKPKSKPRDATIMILLIVPGLEELEILDLVVIPMEKARVAVVVVEMADLLWIRLGCLLFRRCFRDAILLLITINTLTIMAMTLEVLSRALPFRPDHLITGQNVRDLMAALPWNVNTGANIPEPMSFEITVDVSPALIRSNPYLALFVVNRKNRRSHAGARKQILRLFLITMREGWCDQDLLLDPYFLHFPKRTDKVAWYPGIEARSANLADPQLHRREPVDLIAALAEADPWRTHYRLHHAIHPARWITRLAGKFFNMAALNPNAPPLPPQP
ncbi:hypothetical protein PHMEG_00024772 [Phytophthora megakarya]|uniref:Uncharacterized protein n=1 Tax=Phytophthora megakarya TaxID=4795 RepID=A0A225VG69_9STRA|nr:hypothetical protein PHMEG_00024772 [Phytophthora megakarya]